MRSGRSLGDDVDRLRELAHCCDQRARAGPGAWRTDWEREEPGHAEAITNYNEALSACQAMR